MSNLPIASDGDPGFVGIDMLHDRSMLQPGYLARGENNRMRDGALMPRASVTYPVDFNPAFVNKIIGSHVFSNPNGEEVMLVAEAGQTYVRALQFGRDPVKINLSGGNNTGTGFVHFVQAFEKVILLRYPFSAGPQLIWDGDNAHTFDPIVLTPGGYSLAPQTINGVPFANRVLYYNPYYASVPWRDQVAMSDVLDYTSYDPVLSVFRINAGESDIITSVFPYFKGSIIIFMRDSVHMLENFTIRAAEATQRLLNGRIGSVGYQGPVQVGQDIWFLSQNGSGIYRLSEVIQDQIGTPPVPVSRKIQPLIDSIDWGRAIIYHSSAALEDYVYFALTRKGYSGAADCIAVANAVSGEWESAPDWYDDPDFRINRLHVMLYETSQRVFAIDYEKPKIYVLNDGLEDQINADSIPVKHTWETRGVVCGDPAGFKRFERAVIGIRSYDPNLTVTALSDGYNEEKVVARITKNRRKFYTHAKADFAPETDDPTLPKRQDYSVEALDNSVAEDFEELQEGSISAIPATGSAVVGPKQQSLERFLIRQNGRWVSLRGENTIGQCDILGWKVESIPAQDTIKVVA